MKLFIMALVTIGVLESGNIVLAELMMPLKGELSVMNTLSTLQFYGSIPGFHHGLDLRSPAGDPIYAPVSGQINMRNYYPRAKSPYTYEVSIITAAGNRWELHHIDEMTIPESVRQLAQAGGEIRAGIFLGRIFDAEVIGQTPHLHINILNSDGHYINPRQLLPTISDKIAPTIRGAYLIDKQNRIVSKPAPGQYNLIIDIVDVIPPSVINQSIYSLEVITLTGEQEVQWKKIFDQLPVPKDFISGSTEIYQIDPIKLSNGKILTNQIDQKRSRTFVYKVPIELKSASTIKIIAADYNGNQSLFTLNQKVTE